MPELPEVETVARTLAPSVVGRRLVDLDVLNPGTWQGPVSPGAVCAERQWQLSVPRRRGKLLLLGFESGGDTACNIQGLAFHLKMTGRLFAYPAGTEPGRHTRAILHLDDGTVLFFDDARKFGYIRALEPQSLQAWNFWQTLGPEPLEIGPRDFVERFRHRKSAMKSLLLNQTIIAGIGNIYADESLFRAGIRPQLAAHLVDEKKLQGLHTHLVAVLQEAINACGSSIRDYRTAQGDAGAFQNTFRVYGRGGQPCVVCGAPLEQIRVAGRTTVYCPRCQC